MAEYKLGLIVGVVEDIRESFRKVAEVEVPTCQLSCTAEALIDYHDPGKIREIADEVGIEISAVFMTFQGQKYNLIEGPPTMGLVPPDLRPQRLAQAKNFSDAVKALGVRDVVSHIGFIPEEDTDPIYPGFIDTMKELVDHCAGNGQRFLFETGQETPRTLMRTIRDVDRDNLGINFDPGNLVLYGMGKPLEAVDIFKDKVWAFHAKDGIEPAPGESLGQERPLGEGNVQIEKLIPALLKQGFQGPFTIEREISGPDQKRDILKAKALLEGLVNQA